MRLVSKSSAAARRIDGSAKSRREQLLDQAAREGVKKVKKQKRRKRMSQK